MAAATTANANAVTAPEQSRQNMRPRSPSLENYRRVEKPREPTPDDEIRVMGIGRVGKYVTYASKLFKEQDKKALTIRATGKAISVAVSVCEVVKRKFDGLHQVTTIGWTEIVDEYEPLEPGLEKRSEKRSVPSVSIFLTFEESAVDKKAVGYQQPLDPSLHEEKDTDALVAMSRPRRDQRRRSGPRQPRPQGQEGESAEGTDRPVRARKRNSRRGTNNRRSSRKEGDGAAPAAKTDAKPEVKTDAKQTDKPAEKPVVKAEA